MSVPDDPAAWDLWFQRAHQRLTRQFADLGRHIDRHPRSDDEVIHAARDLQTLSERFNKALGLNQIYVTYEPAKKKFWRRRRQSRARIVGNKGPATAATVRGCGSLGEE